MAGYGAVMEAMLEEYVPVSKKYTLTSNGAISQTFKGLKGLKPTDRCMCVNAGVSEIYCPEDGELVVNFYFELESGTKFSFTT